MVITDFGLSKDVSEESITTSSGIELGTFKYCAPEAALQLPRGRAADIFSLGCVFSQMIAVIKGESLAKFEEILEKDEYSFRSFQGNIENVYRWQERLRSAPTSNPSWAESQLFHLINTMMRKDPLGRPNASQVCLCLYSLNVEMEGELSTPYHGRCCPIPPWPVDIPGYDGRRLELLRSLEDIKIHLMKHDDLCK